MGSDDWSKKVYRLRRLPHYVVSTAEVATLLSGALSMASEDLAVYSLASSSNRWESPPSKVATLQLRYIPEVMRAKGACQQWDIPSVVAPSGNFILDTHFEGMTVLNDVDPQGHHTDCISISGLASHPFGSWQAHGQDKSFMWLRDELPQSIAGVRMITYGYDSRILESTSFQTISDISLGLVHELKSGGWDLPSSKPIVFLAHSLGGVVLKNSILQMADNEIVASILGKFKGAIMFGVPSFGMYQSHLLTMAEGQPNEMLIQDLSRENGSAYLRQLNTRFDGLSFVKNAKIYWAYETKETATIVKQINGTWTKGGNRTILVNPDSATYNYNTKNPIMTIPIDKNHSDMVKYSRGDRYLETVIHTIRDVCYHQSTDGYPSTNRDLLDIEQDTSKATMSLKYSTGSDDEKILIADLADLLSSINEIHNDLYSPELDFRIDQIEDPFQHTFKWIFELPIFYNWLQEGLDMFWINGKPGSGKSTIMKYIFRNRNTWELLHDWRRSTGDITEITAGFFFHYRGTPLQKSFEGILRSVVLQILEPHKAKFVKRWGNLFSLQQKQRTAEMDVQHLRKLLEDSLSKHGDDYSKSKENLRYSLREAEAKLGICQMDLTNFAKAFEKFRNTNEANFIRRIVFEWNQSTDGIIMRSEKLLRLMLDQDIVKMDIVLFFDALDEFDGHKDMISRFLKSLVSVSTSTTRVKVCFSSRPWEILQEHFSSYAGICLEDHTGNDIAEYAAGRIIKSASTNPALLSLIPQIVTKASGVFLWVKLAVSEVLEASSNHTDQMSAKDLEQTLLGIPEDLHDFYVLIVERITQTHRRRTFALLELIIRQQEPQSAKHIWTAVLISEYSNFTDAMKVASSRPRPDLHDRQTADISAWGGGLVEVKKGMAYLMHQTVLEFVTSLQFKSVVLGNLATLVSENGHSFQLKFLLTLCADDGEYCEHYDTIRQLAYHAEKSELTMGKSHIDFIRSVPLRILLFVTGFRNTVKAHDIGVLLFAFFCGLALCARDAVIEDPGVIHRVCYGIERCPLLSTLVFSPMNGDFQSRYFDMARLLMENQFELSWDPDFFQKLMTGHGNEVPESVICQLASLVLNYGQDPDVDISIRSHFSARPLHIASPKLAVELIRHGADVNCHDSSGATPLDWVLRPSTSNSLSNPTDARSFCDWRYQKIEILLDAGAYVPSRDYEVIMRTLDDFDMMGYDTKSLRSHVEPVDSNYDSPETIVIEKPKGIRSRLKKLIKSK